MSSRIRIAVANIQTGIATTRGYWHYLSTVHKYALPHDSAGLKGASAFLRQERVDVFATCEIEGGSRRTRGVDQVSLLAAESGLTNYSFFPTFVVGSRINMGNAVCSRFPVHFIRNHPLPGKGEPRFLSEAEVAVGETRLRVFVTHLSRNRKMRVPQIHHIAEILSERSEPRILAGDFNVTAQAELSLLSESRLNQVISPATYPSWRPKRHLDHLFFSADFRIVTRHAFKSFRFSDHLPLVAEVVL